jgi:hypothetical protein
VTHKLQSLQSCRLVEQIERFFSRSILNERIFSLVYCQLGTPICHTNRALTTILGRRFVYVCKRRAESESRASDQGQSAKLIIHKNGSGAATRNSSETSILHKMLRIEPRIAFIKGVLLANRVLIFCFQLLAVYVLLVHNCGECRIWDFNSKFKLQNSNYKIQITKFKLQSSNYKIQITKFKLQNSKYNSKYNKNRIKKAK